MAVISGNRAEEFHLIQFAPWRTSHDSVGHGPGYGIVHDVQAGIAVNDNGGRIHLHHIRQQYLGLVNSCKHTVIAAVRTVLTGQVAGAAQYVHHTHGKVQLLHTRLSPGHIQLQVLCLKLMVLCFQVLTQ